MSIHDGGARALLPSCLICDTAGMLLHVLWDVWLRRIVYILYLPLVICIDAPCLHCMCIHEYRIFNGSFSWSVARSSIGTVWN